MEINIKWGIFSVKYYKPHCEMHYRHLGILFLDRKKNYY